MTDAREEQLVRLEAHLGRLLLGGLVTAAVLLAVGLALWMGGYTNGLASGLLAGGLFVLMATPILRVVVSLVEYARMRDWFFVVTTLVVLAVLLTTVAVALLRR
jgi:uncharacterized membrane protein